MPYLTQPAIGSTNWGSQANSNWALLETALTPVYVKARSSIAQGLTANVTDVIFGTVDVSAGGGYNAATGVFTAPIAGFYSIKCTLVGNSSSTIRIYKNGIYSDSGHGQITPNIARMIAADLYLAINNTVSIRNDTNMTLNGIGTDNHLSISRYCSF